METLLPLRGLVARTRYNEPGSDRPFVESEYVKKQTQLALTLEPDPEPEWTTKLYEAETFEWVAAQTLAAKLGFPTHAVQCAREEQKRKESAPLPRSHVEPDEAYRRMERRGLA